MAKKTEVTREQAEAALAVVEQFGRQAYKDQNAVDPGQAMGMGIWRVKLHSRDVLALAAEALEAENFHIECAIVTALKLHHFQRKGRNVKIVLPEFYAEVNNHVVAH